MCKSIFAIIALSMMASCSKSDRAESALQSLTGSYTGTFKRYHIGENKTAPVNIQFEEGEWTGSSEILYYPAISRGVFRIVENEAVEFENQTMWPANFDWSYILDGTYLLHRNNDSLIFTRSYGNGAVDVYRLAKLQ